jgi:two-component system sensor histidine kinase BaeS
MHHLSSSTFYRVFVGITLTATLVLAVTQIVSYLQLKSSFDLYATKQVIVLKQIGENVLIKENYTLPADFQAFIDDYRDTMARHVLFAFAIGVVISLIAGLILSRQITKPLSVLRRTIRDVTKTHYQIRAPETGSRELQEMIHSFNRLIDELQDQEKMRQDLLTDVTHELKTPITKIRGQIEGMIDGVYPLTQPTLNRVVSNITQLEYLIQALYEINRLTPQDVDLKLSKVMVKQVIDEAISGHNQKPIKFVVTVSPKLTIMADRHRLQQIIDNLVANAYKFTDAGTITIDANPSQFSIQDSGIGIHEIDLPHIFDRLYRAEKSRSLQTGGLGIGLYIVKQLVNLHGWSIKVLSQVGQGTTFNINWATSPK